MDGGRQEIKAKNLDRDDPPITGKVVACLWASCWSLFEHSFATLHRTFGQDDPTARFISESLDGVHVRLLLSKSCPSKAAISRSNAVCCTVLTTQRLCSAGQTALQGTCPKIYRIEIKQNHQTALEKKNKLKCRPCLRGCSGQRWPNLRAGALCFFTTLWFPKPRFLPNLQGVRLQTEKVRELMYRCVEMDHLLSAPSTITTSSQGGASQPTIASIWGLLGEWIKTGKHYENCIFHYMYYMYSCVGFYLGRFTGLAKFACESILGTFRVCCFNQRTSHLSFDFFCKILQQSVNLYLDFRSLLFGDTF